MKLDPQAGAISRIRHQIFVRRKSARKIWLAVFATKFSSAEKVRLAEYYYRRKILLHYHCIRQWQATELRDGPCDPTFQNFQVPIYIVIPLFASEKYFHAALQPYLRKKYR